MDMMQIRQQFPQYDDLSDGDLLMKIHRKYYPTMHVREFLNNVEGGANAHVTAQEERDYWVANAKKPMTGEDLESQQKRMGGSLGTQFTMPGRTGATVRSGMQGLTYGGADEAVAGVMSMMPGRDYKTELERERSRLESGREQFPLTATAAEIGGAVLSPIKTPDRFVKGSGAITRGLQRGAQEGALYGALSGEGGADRLKGAAIEGGMGGVLGGALGGVTGGVRSAIDDSARAKALRQAGRGAPTPAQMETRAKDIYQTLEQGPRVPQGALADAATTARRQPQLGSVDPLGTSTQKSLSREMGRLEDFATDPAMAGGVPYTELQKMRRRAGNIPTTAGDLDRGAAAELKAILDDVVDANASPDATVREANNLWRRISRVDDVQEALEKAKTWHAGEEAGIRHYFSQMLTSPKFKNKFNETERQALQAIARGTPAGNFFRRLASLGGGSGRQVNMHNMLFGAGLGGGVGSALGLGPAGTILAGAAVPMIGKAAEGPALGMTQNRVQSLLDILTSGAQIPAERVPGMIEDAGLEAINRLRRAPSGILEMLQ